MKRTLIYLLPLLMAFATGCLSKPDKVVIPPSRVPEGTFTGKFRRLHLTVKTHLIDTLNANLTITFDASGNYAVSGDTSIHAGCKGLCILGVGDDLVFTDKNPSTTTQAKQHLNGDYLYTYDGSNLQLLRGVGDTLSYQYNFNKSSN